MKKISRILAASVAAASVASVAAVAASAYNGYIGFQTTTYSFRNSFDEASYGGATPYFNSIVVWGEAATDPETYPDYEDDFDYDIAGYAIPANYTDVVIDGAGTYTVKAEGIDWGLKGENDFNLIFVSTDAPNDGTLVCTEAKIIVDGETVKTVENPVCDESQAHFNVSLANIWNPDIGSYGLAYPTESLAIEFTIAGDAAAEAEVEETPAVEEAPVVEEAPAAGDVAAATDSSKGSPDTGIESVAVIGGLAVLAGAGIALTRKRK